MVRDKKEFNQKRFNERFDFWSRKIDSTDSCLTKYGYLRDLLLMKYTRGDSFEELKEHFEETVRCAVGFKKGKFENGITDVFHFGSLEREIYPFLAFAIALPVSDDTWNALINLHPEGKDYITDKIVATRNPERKIASFKSWDKTAPAHYKYFKLLGEALATEDKEEQLKLVYKQLRKWRHKNWRGSVSIGSDPDLPKNPSYYGQFSYEVAAVVMAFDIDDSSFKEDIYYPKELVEYFRERTKRDDGSDR